MVSCVLRLYPVSASQMIGASTTGAMLAAFRISSTAFVKLTSGHPRSLASWPNPVIQQTGYPAFATICNVTTSYAHGAMTIGSFLRMSRNDIGGFLLMGMGMCWWGRDDLTVACLARSLGPRRDGASATHKWRHGNPDYASGRTHSGVSCAGLFTRVLTG